jgi:hypothetical protein
VEIDRRFVSERQRSNRLRRSWDPMVAYDRILDEILTRKRKERRENGD